MTNKIYVANFCGNDASCNSGGTVSVIDGATNTVTHTVAVGQGPGLIFADPATNKVWVLNSCGTSLACVLNGDNSHVIGSMTQIDGATLATSTANTGQGSGAMAYNPVANKAYVSNSTDNTETFIDGVTLATNTVVVGQISYDVEVNPVTNKIYVCNNAGNSVTTIDGTTLATTTIGISVGPVESWVNPAADRVYIYNTDKTPVSVLGGIPPSALQFVPVTPCRLVDTPVRETAATGRSRPIAQKTFRFRNWAAVTFLQPPQPTRSTLRWSAGFGLPDDMAGRRATAGGIHLNSLDGRIKANAAIVPAGYWAQSAFTSTIPPILCWTSTATSRQSTRPRWPSIR